MLDVGRRLRDDRDSFGHCMQQMQWIDIRNHWRRSTPVAEFCRALPWRRLGLQSKLRSANSSYNVAIRTYRFRIGAAYEHEYGHQEDQDT